MFSRDSPPRPTTYERIQALKMHGCDSLNFAQELYKGSQDTKICSPSTFKPCQMVYTDKSLLETSSTNNAKKLAETSYTKVNFQDNGTIFYG